MILLQRLASTDLPSAKTKTTQEQKTPKKTKSQIGNRFPKPLQSSKKDHKTIAATIRKKKNGSKPCQCRIEIPVVKCNFFL
jgi:hypothetical protein